MGEWYYIGHYGQLGPLTLDQIEELIQGGVIVRDTYVWRTGMTDWVRADMAPELQSSFRAPQVAAPPPPPMAGPQPSPASTYASEFGNAPPTTPTQYTPSYHPTFTTLKSDRSRTLAGVLQLLIPGVGRMYMGFAAIGVLQLILSPCFVGWCWSLVDGILILSGGVKMDGYGRQMSD